MAAEGASWQEELRGSVTLPLCVVCAVDFEFNLDVEANFFGLMRSN